MDKRSLSERDICTKFITPALVVIGCFSFLVGQLTELPLVSIPPLAIARVLP